MDDLAARLQRALGGDFSLDRELPGGGMARVFMAREAALGRAIVVKVLDLEGVTGASAERFRREMRLLAELQHPHIVQLITAGEGESLLWYAMPFVAGESVRARLTREGALPVADAVRITREVLVALAYAHERGVMHRDVKPENILLSDGHAVLADFGVAKVLADAGISGGLTTKGMAIGTPAYMAPEQAMAESTTNHRADLYAAGVVLYEMLIGAPPFSGSVDAVIAAHLTAAIPRAEERRPGLPATLTDLLPRLLAKGAAQRPQSAREVIEELEAIETLATRTGTSREVQGRKRAMRVGLAAVLALAGAVAGLRWWTAGRGQASDEAGLIAVMPLVAVGDSSLAQLGQSLAFTLSTDIDHAGDLRTVHPFTVHSAVRRLDGELSLESARRLAGDLGAGSTLVGSLRREGDSVHGTVDLFPVDGGDRIAHAEANALAGDVQGLTDSLARRVLEQIWRTGKPPVPVLTELTTGSPEALRAFLSGEAYFQRMEIDSASVEYRRAIAADTLFAQAYFRLVVAREMFGRPRDTILRRRLIELRSRLPLRDQDVLGTYILGSNGPDRLDSLRDLAGRQPSDPLAQYLIADYLLHKGPLFGIDLRDARPYLDKSFAIAPEYADNTVHLGMYATFLGDSGLWLSLLREVGRGELGSGGAKMSDRSAKGLLESYRSQAPKIRGMGNFLWLGPRMFVPLTSSPTVVDSALRVAAHDPSYAGIEGMVLSARAHLSFWRGDLSDGLRQLAALETQAGAHAPTPIRMASARYAVVGAWLEVVPIQEARVAVDRVRTALGRVSRGDSLEFQWLRGVVGVVSGDSVLVHQVIASLAGDDTLAAMTRRSIVGLWRSRNGGSSDSLRSLEDELMANRESMGFGLALDRWAIARDLVGRGKPDSAERYLRWTDAVVVDPRLGPMEMAFHALNAFERARAFEVARDTVSALHHYRAFLHEVDLPNEFMEGRVAVASQAVARLSRD